MSKGLFLLGPPGVGKTHLAVAALRQIINRTRAHGLFYDTRELLRVIRSTFGSDPMNRLTESDVLRPVIEADVLVLDDLGAEKTSEWVEETLNYVVNARYSERRLTLFTSNYDIAEDATDPDSLQVRVGFRMYSRLHEMCEFLHLYGADYRELPQNGGVDDLKVLWKMRQPDRGAREAGDRRPRLAPAPRPARRWRRRPEVVRRQGRHVGSLAPARGRGGKLERCSGCTSTFPSVERSATTATSTAACSTPG